MLFLFHTEGRLGYTGTGTGTGCSPHVYMYVCEAWQLLCSSRSLDGVRQGGREG